ncbi:Acyltransferase 3 [Penicillium camemberti]|uniref:Acyltransferase 3 n=1 Tax=Penicillium camemberti (strain FM 013) TaxID=1429867 RepID=A0A0G4PD40_PENC3|nr:Acyltransferase 3 [Penicillium camemberti]
MTRLFLPPLTVSFVTMLLIAAGAWDYPAEVAAGRTIIRTESEFHQPRLAGLGAQLITWRVMVVQMLDYGHWGEYYPPYDVHPWAIPMEYRSSMLLFLMFLITVRLRIHYRIGILAALLVYSYSITRWVAVLFLAGAIIAETVVLYPIREHESPDSQECQNGSGREGYQLLSLQEMTNTRGTPLPSSSSGAEASTAVTDSRQRRLYRQVLCTITIIVGLYLMSAPDYCISRMPGYRTVAVLIPPHDERDWRFYPSVGAILLVAALAHSPRDGLLVRGLESRLVQYLGRVSYSLCLVHGPVMHGLGYRVFPLIWAWRWDGW